MKTEEQIRAFRTHVENKITAGTSLHPLVDITMYNVLGWVLEDSNDFGIEVEITHTIE